MEPGDSCEAGVDRCKGGSRCSEYGKCVCPQGQATGEDGVCRQSTLTGVPATPSVRSAQWGLGAVSLGMGCDSGCTENCMLRCGGGSVCRDNVCSCPPGTAASGNRCLPAAPSPTTRQPPPVTASPESRGKALPKAQRVTK